MGTAAFSIDSEERDGRRRLLFRGRLCLVDGAEIWRQLRRECEPGPARLDLDVEGVTRIDGGGAALLLAASEGAKQRGSDVRIVGADGEVARLLDLYACGPTSGCAEPLPPRPGFFEQVATGVLDFVRQARDILAFTGDLVVGIAAAVRRPHSVHWSSVPVLMERAGADGLPIIAVIHFLVGAILGLQGAYQLHRFAADPFLANLVGLSVVRELGPLMTAIVVAGRSGAAYAAELGSMRVNEEVDALRTLGQDPQRFLVFPRVLALFLMVPLLTAFADVIGCLGGMIVGMIELEQPAVAYLRQLQTALDLSDVMTGLIKSGAFAALIGLVACQRGLQTRGGAVGVGSSTTSAVVVVLFGLVALDALFTVLFRLLGW